MTAAHVAALLSRVEKGWAGEPCPPIDELLASWKERVAPIDHVHRETDLVYFRTALVNSRLRGGAALRCLIVGGNSASIADTAAEFVRQNSDQGRLLFFFCMTRYSEQQVRAAVKSDRCVIWSPEQIVDAWSADNLLEKCGDVLRNKVPIRMLMPYDITVSAVGPMFYGREAELGRLSQEDGQSFAVTGPGRIGKTSLVKKYREDLLLKGDPAYEAVFYIDFFECADKLPDTLARRIAMTMDSGRRAARTQAGTLSDFIEYQRSRLRRKPILILDEVDEVCTTSLFREHLAGPARHENCRFILVGKGGVLRFTKDNSIPLASRLRVLRLSEIDAEAARKLLFEPINELGLQFEDFERIFDLVKRNTGRSPHMIQFFGQRLVELAVEESSSRVLLRHVEQLRWDHSTACFFLSPLDDLKGNPIARVMALALLKSGRQMITPTTVSEVARLHDLSLSHSEAVDVADTLVVQNVLSWVAGGYRIANEALPEYAGKMGYLTQGLEEARRQALKVVGRKAS